MTWPPLVVGVNWWVCGVVWIELIPCDHITVQLMDVAEQRLRLLCVTDGGVRREETVGIADEYAQLFWQEFWEEDGCAGPLATGDYSTLLHQAEEWSPRAWADTRRGSAYAELGIKDEILVPMGRWEAPIDACCSSAEPHRGPGSHPRLPRSRLSHRR